MINLLFAVVLWYGLGAVAAAWATHRGHDAGVWSIVAALWGALSVPLLVLTRLAVVARPARLPTVDERPERGLRAMVILHVDDSPSEVAAAVRDTGASVGQLDLVVLVSEEARSRLFDTGEIAKAQSILRRSLRSLPPVDTNTVITSLSALEHMVRHGHKSLVVAATPRVSNGRLNRPTAAVVKKLNARQYTPVTEGLSHAAMVAPTATAILPATPPTAPLVPSAPPGNAGRSDTHSVGAA